LRAGGGLKYCIDYLETLTTRAHLRLLRVLQQRRRQAGRMRKGSWGHLQD